ncbi:MAG: Ig-like domain-containing protein [Burkholderiales bacterium]|nr:Ig-like domain-containing protein [Burkholderiales bacterium]
MTATVWTNSQVLNQLLSGNRWTGATITYAFPTSTSGLYTGGGEGATFRSVTATQQAQLIQALATWDDLIPQSFQQTTSTTSSIEFGYTSTGIGYAHAYFPTTGSVWFKASSDLVTLTVGSYAFLTAIHEIGHALGLNHMGNYNGTGNWTPSSFQDSIVYSVMSYFGPGAAVRSSEVADADWVAANSRNYLPQTPMLNDVMAIQSVYGASTSTRTDDTVYGFSSTVTGTAANIYNFTINQNPILTLWDSGGNDTLNLSGFSTASVINLEAGVYSSCNSMTNNIVIAYNCVIENAVGGSANDVLNGNAVANRLDGGSGNDTISGGDGNDTLTGGAGNDQVDGGAGTDTAVLAGSYASYTFDYNTALERFTVTGASTGVDTYYRVESFQFTDVTRTLAEIRGLTVTTDTTAPTLAAMTPADNATAVAASSNIVLTFSETVQAGSGSIFIYNSSGTVARTISVTDASQVSFAGNTVTINPSADLALSSGYYVNMAAGVIRDLAGNGYSGIAGSTAYNFTTSGSASTDDFPLSTDTSGVVVIGGPGVSGNINYVDDGDMFRVALVAGNTYVFTMARTTGGLTDPYLQLYDPSVNLIAYDDDSAGSSNARVTYTADTSGTYYLIAWDYGTGTGGYTLTGATTGDDYPWSTATTGTVVVNGSAATGTINTVDDKDLFKVTLVAGTTYTFSLTRTTGGLTDPYLILYSPSIDQLMVDDDSGGSSNSRLTYTPTASGTYYLGAMDYSTGTGSYTLAATSTGGATTTTVTASSSRVSEGDTVTFTIATSGIATNTTLTYTVQGVSSTDITGGQLSGLASVGPTGQASISIGLVADLLAEGNETLTVTLGTGQSQSVTVVDTSRPVVAIPTTSKTVISVYSAFFGSGPSGTAYTTDLGLLASQNDPGYAAAVAARFAGLSNSNLAVAILANVKISSSTTSDASYTLLRDALTQFFDAFPASKGQVVLNITNLLAGLERDGTWGMAAVLFNTAVAQTYTQLPRAGLEDPLAGDPPAQSFEPLMLVGIDCGGAGA